MKVKLSPPVVHDLHSCEQIQWKVRIVNPHTHTHTHTHTVCVYLNTKLFMIMCLSLQFLCLPLGQLHTEEVKKMVEKFSRTMRTMQS